MKFHKENTKFIEYYFSLNRNYSIYVSTTNKISWIKINDISDSFYITDKGKIEKNKTNAFCVLYQSGEILHISENTEILPDNAYWIEENDGLGFERIKVDEVELDSSKIVISNEKSKNPSDIYYSTTILNNMNCKIFPIAFGGYIRQGNDFVLNNVIDTVYSAKQFMNWYDCSKEYILPGEKISDPNNYGDGDSYWIYIFKTEFEEILITGIKLSDTYNNVFKSDTQPSRMQF